MHVCVCLCLHVSLSRRSFKMRHMHFFHLRSKEIINYNCKYGFGLPATHRYFVSYIFRMFCGGLFLFLFREEKKFESICRCCFFHSYNTPSEWLTYAACVSSDTVCHRALNHSCVDNENARYADIFGNA